MARLSKKQNRLNDEELPELLHNQESSVILESGFSDDSDMNVDTSSDSKQRENSDDEDSANNNSDMEHDSWMRLGTADHLFLLVETWREC
jgi:hypothetical protein